MRCAIFNCNSDNQSKCYNKNVKFFRFPRDKSSCEKWIVACGRSDKFKPENSHICSLHFSQSDYARDLKSELLNCPIPKNKRLLKDCSIPSLHLPLKKSAAAESSTGAGVEGRSKRASKRNHRQFIETIMQTPSEQAECSTNNEVRGGCSNVLEVSRTVTIGVNTDESLTSIQALQNRNALLETEKAAVEKLFSPRHLQKLTGGSNRLKWTAEDIAKAIVLYASGPRAYRLLLKRGYPYPAVSTLKAWKKKFQILPGILTSVIHIIGQEGLTPLQKICVMSFDEVKIRSVYCYDKVADQVLKPCGYAQVVLIRGLMGHWKQPVFFDYEGKMTSTKLLGIIAAVENAEFPVVSLVSDLGGGNRSLHNELGVTPTKPYFENPNNGSKIYVLADVPHLIKLIRNNFVDYGFVINDKEINVKIIDKLLEFTGASEVSIAHKISHNTVHVQRAQRQKVKHATKLFSRTISKAISRCGTLGFFSDESWLECAEFFELVNDWFDLLNVKVPTEDCRKRKHAYGLAIDEQNGILNRMTKIMEDMRVKSKSFLMPFQKGIIMTNTAIPLLFRDLQARFQFSHILTYRLNQDALEHFFSVIRSKCGLHDHPDALEFKYRLRDYILGKNEGDLLVDANVAEDSTPDVEGLPEKLLTNSLRKIQDSTISSAAENNFENCDISELKYDGLEHIGGFICKKLNEEQFVVDKNSVSTPGLTIPQKED